MANLQTAAPDPGLETVAEKTSVQSDSTSLQNSQPERKETRSGWFQWHEPGTSKEEKRLIMKLDWFLLSFSCLMFFLKQLDGNNVSNAYVSGMREELGFGAGNELSWMNTYFNIGIMLGGPAANMIITVVRPRYWLTFCLMTWSLFVLFLYKCNTASQFYGLRFCIGLFESAAGPGLHYILGSWYRKSELGRRSSLFVVSGVLGQMFSGYLQAALYSGMEGKGGMSAWRWLFIFDFILAIPVAIYGIFCFPDTPHQTTAWWLNEWERKRVVERIEEEGRKPIGKMDLSILKRIVTSWQLYAFSLAWVFWSLTAGSYLIQFMGLWLKASRYSVTDVNNIPTGIGAVNFIFMLSTGYAADKIGSRVPVCGFIGILLTFSFAIFTAWDVPTGLKMFAFFLAGCYGCISPLIYGWVNSSCGGDQHLRAFTLAWITSLGLGVVTPFQLYLFPSSGAPTYRKTHGYPVALAFVVCLGLWCSFGMWFVERWAQKRELAKQADTPEVTDNEKRSIEAPVAV